MFNIKKWLTKDKIENCDDSKLEDWIELHRQWKNKLFSAINETSSIGMIKEEEFNHCCLGKWIEGYGELTYGHLELFKNIKDNHIHFHRCAEKIIECINTDQIEIATKILENDFEKYSLYVVTDLHKLSRVKLNIN